MAIFFGMTNFEFSLPFWDHAVLRNGKMVEIYMMNRMNSLNRALLNLHFVVSFLLVLYCYFLLHFQDFIFVAVVWRSV